jgi:hypothetical protein
MKVFDCYGYKTKNPCFRKDFFIKKIYPYEPFVVLAAAPLVF